MNKPSIWKWLILIGLVAWSLATIYPLDQKLNLGLDLVGGTRFVLKVDVSDLADEDLKRDAPARALTVIRNRIDSLGGREPAIYLEPETDRIVVEIPLLADEDYQNTVESLQTAAFLEFKLVHEDSRQTVNQLMESGEAPPGYEAVSIGDERFFRRNPSLDPEGATESDIFRARRTFKAPPNHELMFVKEVRQGIELFRPVYVDRRKQLTGDQLSSAGVQLDPTKLGGQTYQVTIKFNSEGSKQFARLTSDYSPGGERNPGPVGRQLGIVLDGILVSDPVLREPIFGGNAVITGDFSYEEASMLSLNLRAGALPAPVRIIEERRISPTLGQDSIQSSKTAILLGGVAILLFMLVYYMMAGVIADLALGLDMLLLPLGMMIASGFLGLFAGGGAMDAGQSGLPTLTLAGIAGIVLTIGMAVDANVLIFERIREEQKAGKRFRNAVDAGYDKVFSTIVDANITTMITAIILFKFGSGPIRGFAITLSAGIIVSVYVALVVTRMFFDLIGAYTNVSRVKMLELIRGSSIDFVGKRKIAAVVSLAVILGSWGMFARRGIDNFGVDFTGGASITYEVAKDADVEMQTLRDFLEQNGITAQIQFQRELVGEAGAAPDLFVQFKVPFEQGDQLDSILGERFGQDVLTLASKEVVGPQVGKDLRKQGILSILLALVGIVLYVSVRFEFGFAMGAIVALVHDVLVTVGLFCLFGRELSLPIVAALLTIVGYSVNDTIVVFDRIREDLGLYKGRPYREIANLSINQTLSRTVLTSVTTLLTVVMLLIFGGGAINDFALALLIGILVGTYSSIFVATPVTMFWHKDGVHVAKDVKKVK